MLSEGNTDQVRLAFLKLISNCHRIQRFRKNTSDFPRTRHSRGRCSSLIQKCLNLIRTPSKILSLIATLSHFLTLIATITELSSKDGLHFFSIQIAAFHENEPLIILYCRKCVKSEDSSKFNNTVIQNCFFVDLKRICHRIL
jgi:hypothetical protein